MSRHRSVLFAIGLLAVIVPAGPAAAGGSNWTVEGGPHAPGEPARIWAAVAWGHNPDLGDPDDGPYGVWLHPAEEAYGWVPPDAVYVGDLELDVLDTGYGPHVASLDFVVPELPDGDYAIIHCNRPCTTTLGDITFGRFAISGGAAPPTTAPAPTTTPPTTTPPTTTVAELEVEPLVADDGVGGASGMLAGVGLVGLGLVVAASLWLRHRPPTTS